MHRDLVGRAQPRRCGAPVTARRVGQVDAPEDRAIGRFEGQVLRARPVERTEGRPGAVRPAEGVADGEAHVRFGQLRQRRPVAQLHHGMDDRLRVHHDADAVVVDPEELVGLNHLEALVHQRRRVDGDLGTHRPRRMGQGVGHRDGAQPLGRPAPEGPTRGGEEQPGHVGRPLHRGEALVQRAVLGVHRDDLRPWGTAGLLHDGRPGDERFLVGEGEALASLERRHRHGQPCEADHRVQHDVGAAGRLDHALLPNRDLGPGRHAVTHLVVEVRVADHDEVGPELGRLGHQRGGGPTRRQGVHPEALGLSTDDVERLGTDRARGAHQADGAHQLTRGASP